jgi:SOS-response transcriptional repressor LexA
MPVAPTRVIGEVEAGVFKDALEYEPADQFDIWVPVDPRYRRMNRAALKVRGPSMNLLYPDGSFVIVVPTIELGEDWKPRSGQRVVVQRSNEIGQIEATLKEILIDSDGTYWLVPKSSHPGFTTAWRMPDPTDWNGDHDEDADGIRITGLVVGFYRQEG